ncbi:universal stress protein [Zeaxanthinibacter enoshimensis]|uniref:Nucleotide-binding universal stress UspA family protein n=1 Tax=Zeaxanthinibacter enoshimensis TaxID=392009 RepID=A0A4R6TKA4_9FLAO|nr:universal stress protein [Zeaxanthinibacter enoshimensis]TDQ31067.1 nucleotide-binding universal stress UspA family protein [Zeaxanthinibacter enoshimensis]
MKKLLIPTDFSDNAWNAIFNTVKIYAETNCKIYIMHAYEPDAMNKLGRKTQARLGVLYDSLAQLSDQELGKVSSYLQENHKNDKHQFETLSEKGTLLEVIPGVVSRLGIETVIMGTQGATGAKEIFLGSNTVKVLRQLKNYPILIIPSGYNFQRLQTAVLPTDYQEPLTNADLSPLIHLAANWSIDLHILYITDEGLYNEKQEDHKKLLTENLSAFRYSFKERKPTAELWQDISGYCDEAGAEILVLPRHKHTFFEKIIREAVVKKTAFHSRIPVLFLSARD